MANCKATAPVYKQQTWMIQTLKQNKLIPRQNKLSKPWGNGDVGEDFAIMGYDASSVGDRFFRVSKEKSALIFKGLDVR
jgi:hypothetical protein